MSGPSESGPISSQRFAVVDVETSGLSIRRHHVLQVGVVVIDGSGTVLDRWSSLLAPRSRLWFRVGPTWLHGIHRRDVRTAPPAATVITELASKLSGARFVAHNAEFDLAFLRKAAKRVGVQLQLNDPLCTLRLSRQLDPERTMSHRLGDLCERCGIQLAKPHDALADADATAAVLPFLLQAHSIATVDQLPAWVPTP
ncbi:MAG: 3'-5' exonuclease [Actinomycetia bacterium]|nr:3'-5' exonuclease [Actinomycetes bacterium]